VIRSQRRDQAEIGRRLRRAVGLTFGAMLAVAAIGCANSVVTVSPIPTSTGDSPSGTPLATSSATPQVVAPTLAPTRAPAPTPRPTPTRAPTPTPEPTPIRMPPFNGHTTVYWVFAHPDDETISSAGAMYESQKTGNRNVLITITDGETTAAGSRLGLSPKQVAAARDKEATAALAIIGIVPVFLHEPETGGGVQLGFVEQEVAKLAAETKGTVVFEGLGPDDAYVGLPHGDLDHYTVAQALQAEFDEGVIKNLVWRHLANFSNGQRYGICGFLSKAAMSAKQEMRAAYAYVNRSIGRYGIAGLSVRSMWRKTTTEPECHENVELQAGPSAGSSQSP